MVDNADLIEFEEVFKNMRYILVVAPESADMAAE